MRKKKQKQNKIIFSYGVVHDKFNLNVENGNTLTLCPIMDILCNDG